MQTSKFLLVIGAAMFFCALHQVAAKPDSEEQAKMREALRVKMEELNAQAAQAAAATPPVPAPAPTPTPTPAPAPAPVVKVPKVAPVKPIVVVAPVAVPAGPEYSQPASASDEAAVARLNAALEQKMAELDAASAVVVATPAPAKKPAPVAKPKVVVAPVVVVTPAAPEPKLIEAPASPLPVTKQDRLADLLRRYKVDELTAQEYHVQRAAIIAEN